MKELEHIKATKTKVIKLICDRCGKEYDDVFEMQEFLNIEHDCGYGSVFKDGEKIVFDLCQHCLKEILEKEGIKYHGIAKSQI